MEFRNLTPFASMCFAALDPAGAEHRVVAMKVAYRLRPGSVGWTAVVQDELPMPLCTADEHIGEAGQSSLHRESDLAPYKPRCDVLVRGKSFAPKGEVAQRWQSRIRLSVKDTLVAQAEPLAPWPLNPGMELTAAQRQVWEQDKARARKRAQIDAARPRRTLLDKSLGICGPSEFRRNLLAPGWHRTTPYAVRDVDLTWENAFGGNCRVDDPKRAEGPPLFHEVCFSNPVGTGWVDARWFAAMRRAGMKRPSTLRAPQIEHPGEELRAPIEVRNPKGPLDAIAMSRVAAKYGARPAGWGPVGRAWAPRLALAGTYDDAWLQHKHPGLPDDIDFGYWNGAPQDQQTEFLPLGVRLELWNLAPPEQCRDGFLVVDLPRHRPFVLARLTSGVMLPLPMLTDTLEIDTVNMIVCLTHRISIRAGTPLRALEARFEIDPDAPLVKRDPEEAVEATHG